MMDLRGSHILQSKNVSEVATRRVPSKIRTYSNQNNFDVGYLLTDTERTIILIVSCSIGGIIIISGKNLYGYSYLIPMNRIRDTIEIILIFNYLDGSIVLFCCLYKCYNAFLKTIECHICDDRIRIRDWKNKSSSNGHRKHCSENNKEFLKNLPEPFDVRCPTCFNYLKLLPKVIFSNRMFINAFLLKFNT